MLCWLLLAGLKISGQIDVSWWLVAGLGLVPEAFILVRTLWTDHAGGFR
jgi:hypothetical protein